MSRTDQLKQRVFANGGGNPEAPEAPAGNVRAPSAVDTLAKFLQSDAIQRQIAMALPRHLTPERLVRICTTELRKIPKLAACSPASFVGAVIQCAQLGLEPGGALGHVYLIPFEKRKKVDGKWVTVETICQVIIGYRGMLDLARRSGQIESISAYAVYEGDTFRCRLGLEPTLEHEPDWDNVGREAPDKIRLVYAVARLVGGGKQFVVMRRAEVEAIRARSKSADEGPWVTDYEQMALKTVVRRVFKFLPVSIELQTAVALDEQAERGAAQNNDAVFGRQRTEASEPEDVPFAERTPEPERASEANRETPRLDNRSGGVDPFDDEAESLTANESITKDHLYELLRAQLERAPSPEVVDMVLDEVATMPMGEARQSLEELGRERSAMMHK